MGHIFCLDAQFLDFDCHHYDPGFVVFYASNLFAFVRIYFVIARRLVRWYLYMFRIILLLRNVMLCSSTLIAIRLFVCTKSPLQSPHEIF